MALRAGNLDDAVVLYRRAVQGDPDNPNYKIALERAMVAASRAHLDKAREFEQNDQLEAALGEYRQAAEYDPSNRMCGVEGGRARADDPRSHRSVAAEAADSRKCASGRGRRRPSRCSIPPRAIRCG